MSGGADKQAGLCRSTRVTRTVIEAPYEAFAVIPATVKREFSSLNYKVRD